MQNDVLGCTSVGVHVQNDVLGCTSVGVHVQNYVLGCTSVGVHVQNYVLSCTLYLLACQARVTVEDSSLCYCVCVTSFEG